MPSFGDINLKTILTHHSDDPRALKNYVKCTLPILYITDYFKPTAETCSEKKDFLQNISVH